MWEKWPKLNEVRVRLLKLISQLPLIGPLVNCRLKDHADAASEFLCTIVLGTMPLWLDGLRGSIYKVTTEKHHFDIWKEVIVNGELYLYCSSILAPIFYIALTDKKGERPFPSKLSFVVSTTLILMISAFIFSIKRSKDPYDGFLITTLSVLLFSCSAILLYLATAYRNFKSFDFSKEMEQEEEDFTDQLLSSREIK